MFALGLIETVGYTTAVSAADAAVKAADVEILGLEKVIGAGGYVGVTIHLSGDVAAVTSAVEAGRKQGELVGKILSTDVIPRAHSEVSQKLLSKYLITKDTEPEANKDIRPSESKTTKDLRPEQTGKDTSSNKVRSKGKDIEVNKGEEKDSPSSNEGESNEDFQF